MSFKIIGDSCTDPVPGLLDAPEYTMVPLIIRVGDQEYVDNGMLSTDDLIARMAPAKQVPVRLALRHSGIWMPLRELMRSM